MLGDETSSTVPSKVSSTLKLCLKVICALVVPMKKLGVSSVLLVTQLGSLWKAELGAVSLEVLTVTQLLPSVQSGPPTVQSPSKFSLKVTFKTPKVKVKVTVPRLVAPSCNWSVAVIVPPQEPLAVNVKGREAEPPGGIAP